jgi:hypothetical protein
MRGNFQSKKGGIEMRVIVVATLAASLFATNLMAADAVSSLPPGKPAGVQKAQGQPVVPFWWIIAGVAGAALAVGLSNGGCDVCQNGVPTTAPATTT